MQGRFIPAVPAALSPCIIQCSTFAAIRAGTSLSVLLNCIGGGTRAVAAVSRPVPLAMPLPSLAAAPQLLDLRRLYSSSSCPAPLHPKRLPCLPAAAAASQLVSLRSFCGSGSQCRGSRSSSGDRGQVLPWLQPAAVAPGLHHSVQHAAAATWPLRWQQQSRQHTFLPSAWRHGLHSSSSSQVALGVVEKLHDELPVVLPADGRSRHFWEVSVGPACHSGRADAGFGARREAGFNLRLAFTARDPTLREDLSLRSNAFSVQPCAVHSCFVRMLLVLHARPLSGSPAFRCSFCPCTWDSWWGPDLAGRHGAARCTKRHCSSKATALTWPCAPQASRCWSSGRTTWCWRRGRPQTCWACTPGTSTSLPRTWASGSAPCWRPVAVSLLRNKGRAALGPQHTVHRPLCCGPQQAEAARALPACMPWPCAGSAQPTRPARPTRAGAILLRTDVCKAVIYHDRAVLFPCRCVFLMFTGCSKCK